MPLYEYECEVCGVRFEQRQRITEDALEECPDCGGAVHRLIHPVGIVFKGSGFYVTDNRSSRKNTRKQDEKKAPEPDKSESSSKSEGSSEKASAAEASTSKSAGNKSESS
jgi:putative FmdB family regulatory protein